MDVGDSLAAQNREWRAGMWRDARWLLRSGS